MLFALLGRSQPILHEDTGTIVFIVRYDLLTNIAFIIVGTMLDEYHKRAAERWLEGRDEEVDVTVTKLNKWYHFGPVFLPPLRSAV